MNKNTNDNPAAQSPHSSKVFACPKFPEYSQDAGARVEPRLFLVNHEAGSPLVSVLGL